ncbi:hypothetical protein N7454_008323 [Penicillium verhagenii]|nr:hypothetical protein N7454_008323 [Penicillium verhagenii]
MVRTRSQPLSPGGYHSLDELPPRRRATRSASAEPKPAEPKPAESKPSEPKPTMTRKTRGKSTTIKKQAARKSSKAAKSKTLDSPLPPSAETDQAKALAVDTADQQDVGSEVQMAQSVTPLDNLSLNSKTEF